jgi:hypothetical protein
MLGDIVISVETAARQAEERGHALLDEIRILMVGLGIFVLFSILFYFFVFYYLDLCSLMIIFRLVVLLSHFIYITFFNCLYIYISLVSYTPPGGA